MPKEIQTLEEAGYTLLGWLDENVTGDRKLLVVRDAQGAAEVWGEIEDTVYALTHDGKLYEYHRLAREGEPWPWVHREVPPTYVPCKGCGEPRNPADQMMGVVCDKCTRKRHHDAVK
jgi:hypothetical protein